MDSKNVEKIIAAAREVFLRYGFRRTTMADLARAAQMSRPALYLVFPSKEDVFAAVVEQALAGMLAEIRRGIPALDTPAQKLAFAFEVWYVRPFELVQASPDANDLFESSCECANQALVAAANDFRSLVTELLKPIVREQTRVKLPAARITEILVRAAHGFKKTAHNAAELRQMLRDHLALVLAGLGIEK